MEVLESRYGFMSEREPLKQQVQDYWNRQSCDTHIATSKKFSREYFEEIESFRYKDQPFIHSFAQFTRYRGKRVVEVGFGAGTDFIQWLRGGAFVSGIDLTQEGLDNLTHRINAYGLPPPQSLQVADAEQLPFDSNYFDLGYSFGVLHHTPNTEKAIAELIRVVRPGGEIKIMLYNRRSLCVFKTWVKHALLRGRIFKEFRWAMWNHMESIGTKGYSRAELASMFSKLPVENVRVHTEMTSADYLAFSAIKPINLFCRAGLRLAGNKPGWKRSDYPDDSPESKVETNTNEIEFTGNRLGFFHCISAIKRK